MPHVTPRAGIVLMALLVPAASWAQGLPGVPEGSIAWHHEGWKGFTDVEFILNAFLTLGLAAILGMIIGYHPRHLRTADTLEKIDAPKSYTIYAVIGAIIGIMVLEYGLVIGLVIFGIGGLIRFRTDLRAAMLTGEVILVTLIGLSCGLDLPHVAVITTAFVFVMIYVIDARVTYRVEVKALPEGRYMDAAAAYRKVVEDHGCRVVNEKKNPAKQRVILLFQCPQKTGRHELEEAFDTRVDPELRGTVDWEVD